MLLSIEELLRVVDDLDQILSQNFERNAISDTNMIFWLEFRLRKHLVDQD